MKQGKQERDIPYGTVRKREWSSQRAITERRSSIRNTKEYQRMSGIE
ncbi:hypothetical protein ACIXNV_21050 [Bacteroides fragilis]